MDTPELEEVIENEYGENDDELDEFFDALHQLVCREVWQVQMLARLAEHFHVFLGAECLQLTCSCILEN